MIDIPQATDQPWGFNMYWDRETGLTIEGHVETMIGRFEWNMTSMSLGTRSFGNNPLALYVAGGAVVIVVGLIAATAVYARRK